MPRSNAERVRASISRKRQIARRDGLCISCCKVILSGRLLTCPDCNSASKERKRKSRERKKEFAKIQLAIIAVESAGDAARERHAYAEAAKYYKIASQHNGIHADDCTRIEAKLMAARSLINRSVFHKLTGRQREIALLMTQGRTNNDIAAKLAISVNTVTSHVASIMNRLDINSRHQLIAMYFSPTDSDEEYGNPRS